MLKAFSCCQQSSNRFKQKSELDINQVFYLDFEINELPEESYSTLVTIKNEQFETMIVIIKQGQRFYYQINYHNNKFQSLHQVQQGVFQQLIIRYENQNINIDWLSDFVIIFQDKLSASHQKLEIINNQQFICQQQIQNQNLNLFIINCEANLNVNIKLHPQIEYLHSQTFNNNFYKMSFWVKQLVEDAQNMLIEIKDIQNEKHVRILILWQHTELYYDEQLKIKDQWTKEGWVLFQFAYQLKNGQFIYQRHDHIQETNLPQKFQHKLRLFIKPHKSIIFTEVLLQINQFSKGNLCVPGCNYCDENGYCVQCEIGYLQQGSFCECDQHFKYFFSPSECYIKLDYHSHYKDKTRKQCPTFWGQICPQCEDIGVEEFTYCFYPTNISLDTEYIELEYNYYYLLIQYMLVEDDYLIDNYYMQFQQEYSNIIEFKQNLKDLYILGLTSTNKIQCYYGFYFQNICKKQIRQCKIQLRNGLCKKCLQKHSLLNGKCNKCPANCEFCTVENHQLSCFKCVENFFLNFQRKCIPCKLNNCEQCYHYNGKLNTLERNFILQLRSFKFQQGCSYCQINSYLQIEQRECVLIDKKEIIYVNQKGFEVNLGNYLDKITVFCQEKFKQCQFCQEDVCIKCNDNYFLDNQNNMCMQNNQNIQIFNFNQNLLDYQEYFNLVTFLYYNYSYVDIIKQQKQYYLRDCQFYTLLDKNKIQEILCERSVLFLNNYQQVCSFNQQTCLSYKYHIDFSLNFTSQYVDNNFELLYTYNNCQVSDIYFINIVTSVSLILLQGGKGYIDMGENSIFFFFIICKQQMQLYILYLNPTHINLANYITISNVLLFNISYNELLKIYSYPLLPFALRYFTLKYLFCQNINIGTYSIIQISFAHEYKVEYSMFYNVTCMNLFHSSAYSNSLSRIKLQYSQINGYMFNFLPEAAYLKVNIMQIEISDSEAAHSIMNFQLMQSEIYQNILLQNIIVSRMQSNFFIFINAQNSLTHIQNLFIIESKFQEFGQIKGISNNFELLYIKLQDVNFECKYESNFVINGNRVILYKVLFVRAIHLQLSINTNELIINNLVIQDSQFVSIQVFVNPSDFKKFQPIISKMYLIDNFNCEGSEKFLHIQSKNNSIRIYDLHLHNNIMLEDSLLLLFLDSQYKIEMFLTNNKCGKVCIMAAQNTSIAFRDLHIFKNSASKDQILRIDESSKVLNYIIQSNYKKKMAIVIDEINVINDNQQQKLLYLPSGQKLIDYKVYDYNNIQFHNQIKNIMLINNNIQNDIILGQFKIKVYEYDLNNGKVIKDLSQQQSFQKFEQTQNHFGLNDFSIIFSPYLNSILMLSIEKIDQSEFKLKLFAKTQLCQMGEILVRDQCLICKPELQIYSVKQKSNFCSIVNQDMIQDHLSGGIKLKRGYWRPYVYSSQFEQCDQFSDKCIGGWHTGNRLCRIGCIGAICNACDIYNTRGDGYYLLEQNQCKVCGDFKYTYLLTKLFLIIIMQYNINNRLCIKLVLQLKSNMQNYQKLILQRQVNHLHFHILSKYLQDIPSLVFTILISNLAILKLMVQNYIELPDILTIFTSPVVLEQNSFSCIQKFINLNYNYWIHYFKLIIPILTFNVFFMLMAILGYKKIKSYFLFPIISLFLSQGPNLLVIFISQTLYATYSKIKYANFDLSIRFFSKVHQRNLYQYILPIIVLLVFILPLLLMILIKKQSRNLFKDKYLQMGNFTQPFNSIYQELFNYFKNSSILLLLYLNSNQLSQLRITLLITLIMYINLKNQIYKIKQLSNILQQTGIQLIQIFYFTLFFQDSIILNPLLIVLIILFIAQQIKSYIQSLFKANKLQILEMLNNFSFATKYLGLNNYIQCHRYWKTIKLNHKFIVNKQRCQNDQSMNDIILKTVQTKMTSNSLIEIEMIDL